MIITFYIVGVICNIFLFYLAARKGNFSILFFLKRPEFYIIVFTSILGTFTILYSMVRE